MYQEDLCSIANPLFMKHSTIKIFIAHSVKDNFVKRSIKP